MFSTNNCYISGCFLVKRAAVKVAMMYNLINFTPESNSPQLICFLVLNFAHPLKQILVTTNNFQCVIEMNKFKPIIDIGLVCLYNEWLGCLMKMKNFKTTQTWVGNF